MSKKNFLLLILILLSFSTILDNAFASMPQITTGCFHSLAIKSDGTLWGWGDNSYGQLGDGTTTNRTSPVQIGNNTNWIYISAGAYHTMAIKADGTLWGWGNNSYGQLGDGTTTDRTSPVQIGSDSNWLLVSAARSWYTLALKSNGSLWAFGWNFGTFGDGTTTDRITPFQIGLETNWKFLAANHHSMALKSDGTLWGCGWNSYGQLGDGTTDSKDSLTKIGTDNKWILIATGYYQTLALKSDNTLWGWGSNDYGQLGNGTTIGRNTPGQIGKDTDWTSVSAWDHSLSIKSNGTLWAWGRNDFGQVGDGTTINRYSPVQIMEIGTPGPTSITLISFKSNVNGRKVILRWITGTEIDNIGFNILRSESEEGPYKKINKNIIHSKGSSTKGASYKFTDNKVEAGKTYWYELENIYSDNNTELNGPVKADVPAEIIFLKLDGKSYNSTKNTGGRFISSNGYTEVFASGKKKILITFQGESERNYPISVSYPNNRISISSKNTDKILYSTTYSGGKINITTYGKVGGYIKGKFEGMVVSSENPNEQHTIEGFFRVKRF